MCLVVWYRSSGSERNVARQDLCWHTDGRYTASLGSAEVSTCSAVALGVVISSRVSLVE